MADAVVNELLDRIQQLVAADTKGRFTEPIAQRAELTIAQEWLLGQLADNLDVPARLASIPNTTVPLAAGRPGDTRPGVRAALTEVVESCADRLESRGRLPATTDQGTRDRLGSAISRAYAVSATPRLVSQLVANGRPDDLGAFVRPIVEGDVAAARAFALAVGARIRQTDDEVLAALVGAGHGAAAPAAARLLLKTKPGFAALPAPEQEGVVQRVGAEIEARFGARDLREVQARELTEEIENRRTDISGGATTVDEASRLAAEQIRELHEFLDELPEWHPAARARAEQVAAMREPKAPVVGPRIERPESVQQLVERMQQTVGELTRTTGTLWNGEVDVMPDSDARVGYDGNLGLHLGEERVFRPLEQLTTAGSATLDPDQVVAARQAMHDVGAMLSTMAVPEGDATEVDAVDRMQTHGLTAAVGDAFAADNRNELARRTVSPELATQLTSSDPLPAESPLEREAALGLAKTIDDLKGLDTVPSESLRHLAGQHAGGAPAAAGKLLVVDSGLHGEDRRVAAGAAADLVAWKFAELPETVRAWRHLGTVDVVVASRLLGQQIGRQADALVRELADRPRGEEAAQALAYQYVKDRPGRASHAADPTRFTSDPAVPALRVVDSTGSASPAARATTAEQKASVRDL